MSRFIKVVVGDERGEADAIVMRRDGLMHVWSCG